MRFSKTSGAHIWENVVLNLTFYTLKKTHSTGHCQKKDPGSGWDLLVCLFFLDPKKLKRREMFKYSMKTFLFQCNLWAPFSDLYKGLRPPGWKYRRLRVRFFEMWQPTSSDIGECYWEVQQENVENGLLFIGRHQTENKSGRRASQFGKIQITLTRK